MPSKRRKVNQSSKKQSEKSSNRFPSGSKGYADEVLAAFRLYSIPDSLEGADQEDEEVIEVSNVNRCLRALKLPPPPQEFFDEDQKYLSYSHFVELVSALRDHATPEQDEDSSADEGREQEVERAFELFTHGRYKSTTPDVRITLADLKRVARELREDVDEKILKLMIEEANGESGSHSVIQGVGIEEFGQVMRRAGVFK